MGKTEECISAYAVHKNLHKVAEVVGIPWQTVYVHLRKSGTPVTGDKSRYGSDTDRLAAKGEDYFTQIIPYAVSHNSEKWQAKIDFTVGDLTVDVKAARLTRAAKGYQSQRWNFSLKKQESIADFFVCIAYNQDATVVEKLLLFPGDVVRRMQTINIPVEGGKWSKYALSPDALAQFFRDLTTN